MGLPVTRDLRLGLRLKYGLPRARRSAPASLRFIVTNVHAAIGPARFLCETVNCQRGEMENRLKECQGDLFAD